LNSLDKICTSSSVDESTHCHFLVRVFARFVFLANMFARFMVCPFFASSTPEDLPVADSSLVSLSLFCWDLVKCRLVSRYAYSAGYVSSVTFVPFIKELLKTLLNCYLILFLGAIGDGMSCLSTIPTHALRVIDNAKSTLFLALLFVANH